jgi:hypothetical protein
MALAALRGQSLQQFLFIRWCRQGVEPIPSTDSLLLAMNSTMFRRTVIAQLVVVCCEARIVDLLVVMLSTFLRSRSVEPPRFLRA